MHSSIINKALSILTIIGKSQKPLTYTDLVAASGYNKSTTHRLLSIMISEHLLKFDKQRKTYLLGNKLFEIVRSAYSGYDIQAISLDEMMKLHKKVNENVTIGILDGTDVVYLRVLEANMNWSSMQRPGMREPVHCSATGKALVAYLPENIIDAKFDGYEFTQLTKRTLKNLDDFKKSLLFVRKNGFAYNDREEYDQFLGISAPIFNYMSEPIAAINIWTSNNRKNLSELLDWADELKSAARNVSDLIGGVEPT